MSIRLATVLLHRRGDCRAGWRAARFKLYPVSQIFYAPVVKSFAVPTSVTSKKSPDVYKSCPKMISMEKLQILTPLQKLPKNMGDLGKLIVATCFEKLPKVQ